MEEIIDCLYEAVSDASRWEIFLQKICAYFDAKAAHFVIFDHQVRETLLSHMFGVDPLLLKEGVNYVQQDPRILLAEKAIATHMALDLKQWHDSGMGKFILSHGMDDNLAITMWISQSQTTGFALFRETRKPSFTETDVSAFSRFLPDIRRAALLAIRFIKLEEQNWAAQGALDQIPLGVVIVDAGGHVQFSNVAAQEMLNKKDGLLLMHRQLWCNIPTQTRTLQNTIRKVAEAARKKINRHEVLALSRDQTDQPLMVRLSGLIPNSSINPLPGSTQPVAILYITDPEQPQETVPEMLQNLYGLTRKEAALATLLATGELLESCAETLSVGIETVRTHLKNIFAKTSTTTQADLVRLLVTIPAWSPPKGLSPQFLREMVQF